MTDEEVNKDFDSEVNHAYLPSKWSPHGPDSVRMFFELTAKYSETFRKSYGDLVETIRYGEGQKQVMDIARPKDVKDDAEIVVYIHGGYWTVTSRDIYLFFADPIMKAGQVAVIIGYDQAPQVTMTTIVKEIRDAYIYLSEKFPKCKKLSISGHSAGGHLLAMLLATEWEKSLKLLPISRAIIISGIPDIRPIVHISYQSSLKLTKEETTKFSPILLIKETAEYCKKFKVKVISIVAEHDPPSFHEKAKKYTELLKKESVDATYVTMPGVDHFEIVEKIFEPGYELNKYLIGSV